MTAGLSITRTCHSRPCAACQGDGSIRVNDTNPYGYGPDPQWDEDVECDACDGTGEVIVWLDPLLRMGKARRWARVVPAGAMRYGTARAEAVSPVLLPDHAPIVWSAAA